MAALRGERERGERRDELVDLSSLSSHSAGRASTVFKLLRTIMAKGTKGGYYAGAFPPPSARSPPLISARSPRPPLAPSVRVGRNPGVYTSWDDCAAQVNGFQGARHKKFPTRQEADGFVSGGAGPSSAATTTSGPVVTSGKRNKRTSDSAGPVERAVKRQRHEPVTATGPARRVDPVFGAAGSSSSSVRRVYCDGSSRGNGKKGAVAGIGVFWGHDLADKCVLPPLPCSCRSTSLGS